MALPTAPNLLPPRCCAVLCLPAGHASIYLGSAAYPAHGTAYRPLNLHLLQQQEPSFDLEEYGLPNQATAVAVGERWPGRLATPCCIAIASLLSVALGSFSANDPPFWCGQQPARLPSCLPLPPAGSPMPQITVRPPAGGLVRRAAPPPASASLPPAHAAVMPPTVPVPAHAYSRAQLLAAELAEANAILSAVEVPGQRQAALRAATGLFCCRSCSLAPTPLECLLLASAGPWPRLLP